MFNPTHRRALAVSGRLLCALLAPQRFFQRSKPCHLVAPALLGGAPLAAHAVNS
jgi:hypothetical protein